MNSLVSKKIHDRDKRGGFFTTASGQEIFIEDDFGTYGLASFGMCVKKLD